VTDDGRTQKLLQALACRPEGATTPQLTEAIGEQAPSWQRAVTNCGNAMRLHERLGRAVRVGTARGRRHQRSVIWRITEDGAGWLAVRALGRLREASSLKEAEARAQDVQVAIARMLDFYRDRAPAAPGLPAASHPPLPPAQAALPAGQWTPRGLAAELQMPPSTVYGWIHQGWVSTEPGDFYIIRADPAEVERLRWIRSITAPRRSP
jgi:hypothetical protein